mgnify:CR=1 FL=1
MYQTLSLIAAGLIAATATTALASPGERERHGRYESESHEGYERSDRDRRRYRAERRKRHNARYDHRHDDDRYRRLRKHRRSDD